MKSILNTSKFIIIILICICLQVTIQKGGLKEPTKNKDLSDISKLDIDKLSEKELDALLKDQKDFKDVSSESIKINPKAAELKKPQSKKSKFSDSYKRHLESLSKEGLNVDDGLNLDDVLSDEGASGIKKEKPGINKLIIEKKTEVEEIKEVPTRPPKNFSFLTEKDLMTLVELFKQPVFFNMLPEEAKTIIKV